MTDTNQTTEAVATEAPAPAQTGMDIGDILKILPHRYPFLLIDRVIELVRMKSIVALKNVTITEPFFQIGSRDGYWRHSQDPAPSLSISLDRPGDRTGADE